MYSDIIFYFCSKPDSPDSFFAFQARRAGKKKEIPFLTPIISSYSLLSLFENKTPGLGKLQFSSTFWSFHISFYRHYPCVLGIINSVSCQLMLP